MTAVCFYFQVHQPFRLKEYGFESIGKDHFYEDAINNEMIMKRVADKCYLPVNQLFLEIIERLEGRFRISYSITGTALEQFEKYAPQVIESFQKLMKTGCVEMLSETYYHSLSVLYSKAEFERQVLKHQTKIRTLFGEKPSVFRNTELIYANFIGEEAFKLGFMGAICEGLEKLLGYKSANFVYHHPQYQRLGLLLKNYKLSDDIAFRFSNHLWEDFPLTADKFANWLHKHAGNAETINLFMDYETFGEHQWKETGIFEFLAHLPEKVLQHPDFQFLTPTEVLKTFPKRDVYDVPDIISWADEERNLSAWLENEMQQEAMQKVYSLEERVKNTKNEDLLDVWSKLQTSDHFYYMSTKFWADGDVHKYFSPYKSPFDAYIGYMNILSDLETLL